MAPYARYILLLTDYVK